MRAGAASDSSWFLGAVCEPIQGNTIQDPVRSANSDLKASFVDIRSFAENPNRSTSRLAPDSMPAMATDTAGLVANCCAKDMGGDVQLVGPGRANSSGDT